MKKLVIILVLLTFGIFAQAGSLVGWGRGKMPADKDFVAIATNGYMGGCGNQGGYRILALKSDGTIVVWGRDLPGQADPPDGNDFVAIDTGPSYKLALKSD